MDDYIPETLRVCRNLGPGQKYEEELAQLIDVRKSRRIEKDENGNVVSFSKEKEPVGIYELKDGRILEVFLKGITPYHVYDLKKGKFFVEKEDLERVKAIE